MPTIAKKREHFNTQHSIAVELTADSLIDKTSNLVKIEEFKASLAKALDGKLTDEGKAILSTGFNSEALSVIETKMRERFHASYAEALERGKSKLKQWEDSKQAMQEAQTYFKRSLEQAKFKEGLFNVFLNELTAHEQPFSNEDEPYLRDAFDQYLDKTAEKYSHSLRDLQSVESIKARIQLHDKNTNSKSDASMTAQTLTPDLNTGTKVEPTIGYKISKDNLREQLKYALSNLKPGEKISIEVSRPDRGEIVKKIAETGFQYKGSLVALLLLLFIQLYMIRKDDVTRTLQAVKDLAEKDGLRIDPKDIDLKLVVTGADGKKQTILEGPLAEPLVQDLTKSIAEVNAQLIPKPVPSNRKMEVDEDGKPRSENMRVCR